MSEFITVQIGQCGNQIGSSFWPLVLQEYGIQNVPDGINNLTPVKSIDNLQTSFHSFFQSSDQISQYNTLADLKQSKVKARAVLIDMEDSVILRYKTGPLRDLFDHRCIVTNYPGSGNNWAEGYCFHGPHYHNKILNTFRRAVEKCDSLHGFLLMFSVGGGTGSGLGTYVVKLLEDYFDNIDRFVTCVYPTGTEDVITCPYNMALSTKELIDHATCVFPVENRALLDIVNRQSMNKHSVETMNYVAGCKPFQDMNSIVVNMLLHLTCGSRFTGNLNVDMNEISTNMVPFPNLHFLASAYNPLTVSSKKSMHINSQKMKDEMFTNCCSRSNQLLKIDSIGLNSVLLGTTLIGRGNFAISDMRNYIDKLQKKAHFTPWSNKAVKIGLCNTSPIAHNAALLTLFNTTAMASLFTNISEQFKRLYQKKAHVHHYTQVSGFDKQYFEECAETIRTTIDVYKAIDKTKPLAVPRLAPKLL